MIKPSQFIFGSALSIMCLTVTPAVFAEFYDEGEKAYTADNSADSSAAYGRDDARNAVKIMDE
jgi:hypothetical protein